MAALPFLFPRFRCFGSVHRQTPLDRKSQAMAARGLTKARSKRSEGNSPSGAVHRAAYLYSVGSEDPNHDAIIRIDGEVPG